MKKSYDLDLFHNMLISFVDDLEVETDFPSYFYQGLYEGKNRLALATATELKKFDDSWIKEIETYIPSIDKIVRNLKSTLRYEEEVVIIEKAKKTDSQTVRHLAANTQYLKHNNPNSRTDLPVTPQKLLVKTSEIEYGIYENRFVKTLILKLARFVSDRVKVLKEDLKKKKYTTLKHNVELELDQIKYQVDLNINEVETLEGDKVAKLNEELLARAEHLNYQIGNLTTSHFMKMMRPYKEVRSPIMKTQIILKNTDYRNCYRLWQFLEEYSQLGYEVIREEHKRRFSESYRKHMNQQALFALSTLLYHDPARTKNEELESRRYKAIKAEMAKITPDNLILNPKTYDIEDSKINEYYLNKVKQNFQAMMNYHLEGEPNYKVALRKAIQDTFNITNALFESYFGINADDQVFKYLIDPASAKDELKQAEEKFKLASFIRIMKEKDLKQSMALEKKWYQELLKHLKKMIKEETERLNGEVTSKIIALEKTYAETIALKQAEHIEVLKNNLKKNDEALAALKAKYQAQYKLEVEKMAAKVKALREKEKARLKKQKEEKLRKQKLKLQKEKQKQKALLEQQKLKLKKTHEIRVNKLKKSI